MGVAPAPDVLEDGLRLVGQGDRSVNLGITEIPVYRLAFYVDAPAAARALAAFNGQSSASLQSDPIFYKHLVEARFRKSFHITFHRALGQSKLQSGLRGNITKRVGQNAAARRDTDLLLQALPSVVFNDVLSFHFHSDGETLEVVLHGESRLLLRSRELWMGVQLVYFDEEKLFPAIHREAVRSFPEVVYRGVPAVEDTLATAVPLANSVVKKTWKEYAGRCDGKSGYQFGDITRGMFKPRSNGSCGDSIAEELCRASMPDHQGYLQEITRLRSELDVVRQQRDVVMASLPEVRRSALFAGFSAGALAIVLLWHAVDIWSVEQVKGARAAICVVLFCIAVPSLWRCRSAGVRSLGAARAS
eukprot:gnl/TRDRNA2_/TRDRNA2_137546_c0_seq1.p1 gnl/TRDRNA2_/TRDRNA2_137546_c0~~gnl/TRDRNA2_/TRDRNA2_137546_c0_seq1.p1  ORF type:complete len:371 (+),score=66.22 gnl/TRDRNA2_/TRDRNA2_137546_c0_seq1:35-1114(+)